MIELPQCVTQVAGHLVDFDDWIGHERKAGATQTLLYQRGVNVSYSIPESINRTGVAIVNFIRVKDMTLVGKALPDFATIKKLLNTRQRDANRVGIMAVTRKRVSGQLHIESFDTIIRAVGSDADPRARPRGIHFPAAAAQAFKTSCRISQYILRNAAPILAALVVMGSPVVRSPVVRSPGHSKSPASYHW
jgi:hypothetical protein